MRKILIGIVALVVLAAAGFRWAIRLRRYLSASANSQRQNSQARTAPASWAATNSVTSAGRIPANVSEKPRAIVTAGLANEVDAVNQ